MAAEKFTCSISVMRPKKDMLLAGTEFEKSELDEAVFKQLSNQGYIKPAGEPEPVLPPGMRTLVNRQMVNAPETVDQNKGKSNIAGSTKAKGKQAEALKQADADGVWNVDPETLKDLPFEVLVSAYQDVCLKYKIKPSKFEKREEVIAQLSAQFVKK